MDDILLTPPASWADAVRTLTLPELVLSYYPNRLAVPGGRSLTDVARDLASGAWLDRNRSTQGEIFRLGGAEFELRVRRQRGRESQAWMAVVLNVDEARSVPRKAGRIDPRAVDFTQVWFEAECDLEEIDAELRRRQQHLHRDGRGRVVGQPEVRAHSWLHDEVLRQYGELRTLINVLEQRPERAEDATSGTIVARPPRRRGGRPPVVVAPRTPDLTVFRYNKRVQLVRADGRSFNTQVTRVQDGFLEIAEPLDWSAPPGEDVSVSTVPPFGMRQNAQALKQFLSGDVEGSWDDLARLLCRPADLGLSARPPSPATFYSDADPDAPDFNDEQRRAVAGAVGSPHTFLVQGPPGTGKTEVICEIVRHLAARGERVLLLAPAHVAVDEVLRKPGIRPLRITWSDDRVDQELRPFLPNNVGIELARRVLRPTDKGQAAQWMQEGRAVDERLAALAGLRDVEQRRAAATDALRSAAATAVAAAERLHARTASAENDTAFLRQALAADEQALAEASVATRAATEFEEVERADLEPGLTALRENATALVGAVSAEATSAAAATEAMSALRGWWSAHQAELASLNQNRAAAERAVAEARRQVHLAADAVGAAEAALAGTVDGQTGWGRFTERLGLGAVTAQRRALAAAQDTARQWHGELCDREAAWHAATVAHRDLLDRVTSRRDELDWRVADTQSLREHAAADRSALLRRLVDALSAVGGACPPGVAGTEDTAVAECERFGLAVCQAVDAVLEPTAWGDHTSTLGSFGAALEPVVQRVSRLRHAGVERERRENELIATAQRADNRAGALRQTQADAVAELARLTAEDTTARQILAVRRGDVDALMAERDALAGALGDPDPLAAEATLLRRRHVLERLPALEARWRELAAERTDAQLADDIQTALVRATNLVCATTKGIVGRGSDLVRHTDYDTLIVDEASRVTESEFLIGAVKARRWVLVGDEHQLPPHVDQDDEHFLHALLALHRVDRSASPSLEQAVNDLAELWTEDDELHVFRTDSVLALATELDADDQWRSTCRTHFAEARDRFTRAKKTGVDVDKALLGAMIRYLVQSLFQRAVASCAPSLCQPLVWQRRMIAPLAQVVSEPIYGGRYQTPPDTELAKAKVRPLVIPRIFVRPVVFIDTSRYRDAEHTQVGTGCVNVREQELVVKACEIYNEELSLTGTGPVTASVLSFYRAQAQELERELFSRNLPMLDWQVIDVIDRIQGQQSDLVVISFTRAKRGGFGPRYGQWLQDVRRLNVACTRASTTGLDH
ncbi:MAG: AAA domain-containing protein [Pseudonocardiaceae bacterium]